ncbi:MAG: hypothetical protein U5L96_17425 [Owenweeksia sp.]|nr:hypothetical protein [Owenweeksia sp.]
MPMSGPNTLQITASDVNGNQALANVMVTVVDTNKPQVQANDIALLLDANGQASITSAQINDASSAICGLHTVFLDKYDFDCSHTGLNKVLLTAVSVNGAQATDTADVTVLDFNNPTVLTLNSTVYLDANGQVSITTSQVDDGLADACGIDTLYLSQYDFTCADTGLNIVELTAEDVNSNSSSASASMMVVDTISPFLAAKTTSVFLNASGQAGITPASVVDSTSDNCSAVSLSLSKNSFDCSDVGSRNIMVTAEDNSGNITNQQSLVNIVDTIDPMVVTQDITLHLDASGNACYFTCRFRRW